MKSARRRSPRTDNMKCVRYPDATVRRVANDKAEMLVAEGARYCPKRIYKEKSKATAK